MGEVENLAARKKERDRKRYADLVLSAFDNLEHKDKREFLDKKAETQIKAREQL